MALFRLVDDLMRDKSLRRRFAGDAESVMDEYSLSKREKRILQTMDPSVIKTNVPAEMREEVGNYPLPQGEFPPSREDFLVEAGGSEPQYPSPKPGIYRYRTTPPYTAFKRGPPNAPEVVRGFSAALVNATAEKSIEVIVWGQSFSLDATLRLERVHPSPGQTILSHRYRMGTFRNTILRGVFTFMQTPPNIPGPWTVGDEYELRLINLPTPPNHPNPPDPLEYIEQAKPRLVVLP